MYLQGTFNARRNVFIAITRYEFSLLMPQPRTTQRGILLIKQPSQQPPKQPPHLPPLSQIRVHLKQPRKQIFGI